MSASASAIVFALVATALSIAVFGIVLRPLWTRRARSAAMLTVGLVLLAGGLYRVEGTPLALDAAMVERPATLAQAIAQLERSRDRFPDLEGWVMLAGAYAQAGRFVEARDTWTEVLKRAPDEPDYLAAAAEARAQADTARRFDAQAVDYLEHALKLDANHQRARFFLGIALRQQGKPAEAARLWEPLLATLGDENGATLRAEVDAARRDAGLPPLPAPKPAEPGAHALTVTVALDPAFAERVRLRGDATVFVIARQPDGPPMPIAVEKHTVSELPLKLVLDDGDGPMPMAKLSTVGEVEVLARISDSGSPMRQPGDIESKPVRTALPAKAPVALTLGGE
jgi:cytochrome c-type biogenesis protein CcmH